MKKVGLILLVDDDSAIRELFSMCLRREGYEVQEAANGRRTANWRGRVIRIWSA